MWLGNIVPKNIITTKTKFIIIPVKLLDNSFFFNFLLISWNIKWCKCKLSADLILIFSKNCLLKIENKFSKAGYHNSKAIKYGEINKLDIEYKSTQYNPIIVDIR